METGPYTNLMTFDGRDLEEMSEADKCKLNDNWPSVGIKIVNKKRVEVMLFFYMDVVGRDTHISIPYDPNENIVMIRRIRPTISFERFCADTANCIYLGTPFPQTIFVIGKTLCYPVYLRHLCGFIRDSQTLRSVCIVRQKAQDENQTNDNETHFVFGLAKIFDAISYNLRICDLVLSNNISLKHSVSEFKIMMATNPALISVSLLGGTTQEKQIVAQCVKTNIAKMEKQMITALGSEDVAAAVMSLTTLRSVGIG